MDVSGGVLERVTDPVDDTDGFRAVPEWEELITDGGANVDTETVESVTDGIVDIFGVPGGSADKVPTDEDELDLVGLAARAEGVGKG